jgi:phage gp29-like protein
MINKVEKIISKIILGHADALDSVPGKLGASQGDTSPAMIAMRDIESSDIKFLENEFDTNVVPKLEALGFPKLGKLKLRVSNNSEKAEKRVKEDANNKVTADIVKVLADAGYKADAAYISERTGIPIKEAAKVEPAKNILRMEAISNKLKGLYAEGCNHE